MSDLSSEGVDTLSKDTQHMRGGSSSECVPGLIARCDQSGKITIDAGSS